ncbi:DEAD/DEAH box helicase [Weissella confusa]|nr:DEAD/DEAH box helicase [Weissella confusa]
MEFDLSLLYGRLVPATNTDSTPANVVMTPAIENEICQRCATTIKPYWRLADGATYCWACANLGRLSSQDVLLTIPEPRTYEIEPEPCVWTGTLTPAQQRVADEQIKALKNGASHLTYAVTGAGKTEMLFPMLTYALQAGKRVAIVSPRVDVIVELAPRIRAAFITDFVTLYGDSPDDYRYTQLVLASTHQLLRFKQAFDVIVIDEVDAFPYAENPQLIGALHQATALHGSHFYLTATPSPRLLREVRRRQMALSLLPRRFHGNPLPNFTIRRVGEWRKKMPRQLQQLLQTYQQTGQRFLLFVPAVADLDTVLTMVQHGTSDMAIAATHATDSERQAKVQAMRDESLQALITTTILERGVTFPGIDVIILGADDAVFSQAALIQIAGRCGRSSSRPFGKVTAFVQERTQTLLAARSEINYLNQMGQSHEM